MEPPRAPRTRDVPSSGTRPKLHPTHRRVIRRVLRRGPRRRRRLGHVLQERGSRPAHARARAARRSPRVTLHQPRARLRVRVSLRELPVGGFSAFQRSRVQRDSFSREPERHPCGGARAGGEGRARGWEGRWGRCRGRRERRRRRLRRRRHGRRTGDEQRIFGRQRWG
jgi:hypothetical protein